MDLNFDISNYSDNNRDIWVDLDVIPVLPSSFFRAPRTTRRIVDKTYYTSGTTLTWQEKRYLVSFVDGIQWLMDTYSAGQNDAPYVPLVHALNKTNIHNKYMKLPTCVVPEVMDEHDEMTLISHDKTNFRDTYSTATLSDGRVLVNGWRRILEE